MSNRFWSETKKFSGEFAAHDCNSENFPRKRDKEDAHMRTFFLPDTLGKQGMLGGTIDAGANLVKKRTALFVNSMQKI